jgi:sugar phosphate permease
VTIACLVTLHNWYSIDFRGFIVSIWFMMDSIVGIAYKVIFIGENTSTILITKDSFVSNTFFFKFLKKYICFSICGLYLVTALLCHFFFFSHPGTLKIEVKQSTLGMPSLENTSDDLLHLGAGSSIRTR